MNKELPKGWKEITNALKEYDTPMTLDSLKTSIMDMMKDVKDFTFLRYCPHEEDLVLFSTRPLRGCEKCIKEMSKE